MKWKVGDEVKQTIVIDNEMITAFAHLTGDRNPIHLDEEFAKKSRFGRRIAHGMLVASQISKLLGTECPGHGTIYLSQTLKFSAPVYINDEITTNAQVLEIKVGKSGKPILTLNTSCTNQKGVIVLDGVAVVALDE